MLKKLNVLTFLLVLTNFIGLSNAQAQYRASISLSNDSMPSNDLNYEGQKIQASRAYELAQNGADLSELNPVTSVLWDHNYEDIGIDDSLPVNAGDIGVYQGPIMSGAGLFRFNASLGNKNIIVHLDKRLHTILLRKNILRLLGYKIPRMKWLSHLTIEFSNLEGMNNFIDSQIPRATLGAASRWITHKDEVNFKLTLKDIAVTIPSQSDHYNLAMGVPPKTLQSRTLRSLIIPYALVDLGESVNKFSWVVGKIENNDIILPHFTRGIFTTTLDDAKWIMRKLATLSREQINTAVTQAYFPAPVASLIVEKLVSRQMSLAQIFNISIEGKSFHTEITETPHLSQGKLLTEDWESYASRFAHGDPESPFSDFHWYALAKIQALGIDNLVARASRELRFFNPQKRRGEFHSDQFEKGLHHFVETGEFINFPIGTWASPAGGINLIASRDVVIGNYLGTDNLVQLADTIGFSTELGVKVGVENVELFPTIGIKTTQRLTKTWTHLKPLLSLKNVFKEPYENIIVPLLKKKLATALDRLHHLSDSDNPEMDWDLQAENTPLAEIVAHLNDKLGVGESILISEKMNPSSTANLGTSFMGTPIHVTIQGGVEYLQIRRVQIYRKSNDVFQIYDDIGNGRGWNISLSAQRFVPILKLSARKQKGDYTVRLHEVNLNPDVDENPELFNNAHALSHFLKTGESELLTSVSPPHVIEADYGDKSSRLAFLFWRRHKLKADTEFTITSSNGLRGNYVSFNYDRQTGINKEAFAKDLINYGLQKVSAGVSWAPPYWQNPAQTIGGLGKTKSVKYEARINTENGHYDNNYIQFTHRFEGWSKKVASLRKRLISLNEKFGQTLFDERTLNTLDGLKLYDIAVNINLYEQGIERLKTMNPDWLIKFEDDYEVAKNYHEKGCPSRISNRELSSGQKAQTCGSFNKLIRKQKTCRELTQENDDLKKEAKCYMHLFYEMYDKLNLAQIKQLVGSDNLYIHGSINGFRMNDEKLNEPIMSHTFGRMNRSLPHGPFEKIKSLLGIQTGELYGHWLRERL